LRSVDASLFVAGVVGGCGFVSVAGLGVVGWLSEAAGDWYTSEEAGFSDTLSFS
jgi:hypothetical protein